MRFHVHKNFQSYGIHDNSETELVQTSIHGNNKMACETGIHGNSTTESTA